METPLPNLFEPSKPYQVISDDQFELVIFLSATHRQK